MSQANVREFPSEDSRTRQERAENIDVLDVREIGNDPTVYEVDAINEQGEERDNIVIIPSLRFENTKDVQHRGELGVVGKYTRALVTQNDQAFEELAESIRSARDDIQEQVRFLKRKEARLLHTINDINNTR